MQQLQRGGDGGFRNVRLDFQLQLPQPRKGIKLDLEPRMLHMHVHEHALGAHNIHAIEQMLRHLSQELTHKGCNIHCKGMVQLHFPSWKIWMIRKLHGLLQSLLDRQY